MTALLLAFLLLQGAPPATGFATGVVRSSNGAPASGVRVYAVPAGDPNVASTGATVFESLAQTDASGRYRLEIRAGRYYIAVGSVSSPTYYPDASSIASAKAITIGVGTTVESVDFSRYNPASVSTSPLGVLVLVQPPLPPGSTGVLSGIVRASDGAGVSGIIVNAVPVSVLNSSTTGTTASQSSSAESELRQAIMNYPQQIVRGRGIVVTDSLGRYRIENVSPDTYNILAGYSDSPVFYPGESNFQKAVAITTTPTTLITTLDITLPPPPKTFSIRGQVSANGGRPAGGSTINLQSLKVGAATGVGVMLPNRSVKTPITTAGDGAFEIPDLIPGKYSVQAMQSGVLPLVKAVEIVDQTVSVDFDFSINVLSGRIVVIDEGSSISDSGLSEVAISTFSNPNFIASTLMPVSGNGTFSSVVDSGNYRFFIRSMADGYIVRTMTSGATDLSKEPLNVMRDVPADVDIRVAKGSLSGAKFQGKIVDAATRVAPAADRLELCCFATGPFERLSTAVLPDGSFEFTGVPPGRYTAELKSKVRGRGAPEIVNRAIEIEEQDQSGVVLVSATQSAPVTAKVTFEDGASVPSSVGVKVALTILPRAKPISIPMTRLADDSFWTPFPTGVLFAVSVTNIPEGYRLKSISGSGGKSEDPNLPGGGSTIFNSPVSSVISIVLQQAPNR